MVAFKHGADNLPGTWSRAKKSDGTYTALAICPECGKLCSLSGHDINEDGTVHPSVVCPYDDCDFHDYVSLEDWYE